MPNNDSLPNHLQPSMESDWFGSFEKDRKELTDQVEALLAQSELPATTTTIIDTSYSSPDEDNLITYLEVSYWMNSGYPSFEDLLNETSFPEDYLKGLLNRLGERLEIRGLPRFVLPVGDFQGWQSKFDPRFVLAVGIVTNVSDKRTKAAKLNEVQVTPAEWDAWLTNSDNYEYYKLMVDIKWKQTDETARLQLMNGIEKGDLQHIKYWHEFTGKHVQKSEVLVNTSLVIAKVMDVLTAHVDPATLNQVANALTQETIFEVSGEEVKAPWELNTGEEK